MAEHLGGCTTSSESNLHQAANSNQNQKVNSIGNLRTNRLFITDKKSAKTFLIDTGADVSVIPSQRSYRAHNINNNNPLYAANGTIIKTHGITRLHLDLGLRRAFVWEFIIADTEKSIIGADFLRHYNLLDDIKNSKLIDAETLLSRIGVCSLETSSTIKTYDTSSEIADILEEFEDLTVLNESAPKPTITDVTHCVETKGAPVFAKARRLPPDKLKAVKDEYEFLIKLGICRPSKSPYASPLRPKTHQIDEKLPSHKHVMVIRFIHITIVHIRSLYAH